MSGYRKRLILVSLITLFDLTTWCWADDTDIYLNPNVPSGSEPLVMFVLDYRPNLTSTIACPVGSVCDDLRTTGYLGGAAGSSTTFFDLLRAVFKKVLDPLGGVRIGFMLNHQHKSSCQGPAGASAGCSNGAYVLSGYDSMSEGTDDPNTYDSVGEDAQKLALLDKLDAITTPQGNLAHPYQGKELYFELFRYLTGQGIYNAHNGFIDFGDQPNDAVNLDIDRPAFSWDTSIETNSNQQYLSPFLGSSACTKLFVVNIMFQVSQQEDDSDSAITELKPNGGMAGIDLSGNQNSFDTVIRYMKDVDLADGSFGTAPDLDGKQNVVSYFIVDPTKINTTTIGYATAGGTGLPLALSSDAGELITTLNSIFKSILSVSATFVSPSVPVNVFNRAQALNEVFLALFNADENGFPFWNGNLKKLVIGSNPVSGILELQDITGANAIDIDGRIKREAITFWTDTGALPAASDDEAEGADGRSVARGGAGQRIPGFVSGSPGLSNSATGARRIFTEDASNTSNGLLTLDADVLTASALWAKLTERWDPPPSSPTFSGASSAEQDRAINLIRFARGLAGNTTTDATTKRSWMLGDALHSRPRPINYGARGAYTASNPDIRILVGTNDGLVHLFNNTTITAAQDGSESWAFLPRAALPLLDRLRSNQAGVPVHPISADGSPNVYVKDSNGDGSINASDGDVVWAFFGMRRGGKAYYALDLTDPDAPEFLWSIEKGDPGFEELAQTWSTPQIGRMDLGNGPVPVVVFGGGYNGDDDGDNQGDLGKDAANRNGTPGSDDDEGHAIYVVEAATGALIWKASGAPGTDGYASAQKTLGVAAMVDSIPSDVAAADMNGDGLLDRVYVGDSGGGLWRADLASSDPSTWSVIKILDVGRHFSNSPNADRRFFNHPDIVRTRDTNGINFDAILIGTGDREHPLDTTVENHFYMFKDKNTTSGIPAATTKVHSDLADLTDDCMLDGSCDATTLGKLSDSGWFFRLGSPGTGEKNLAPAVTLEGIVLFTTFLPTGSGAVCSLNEGAGKQYAVKLADATAAFNYDTSNDDLSKTFDRYDVLESGGIPVQVVPISGDTVLVQGQDAGQNIQVIGDNPGWTTFWYETLD